MHERDSSRCLITGQISERLELPPLLVKFPPEMLEQLKKTGALDRYSIRDPKSPQPDYVRTDVWHVLPLNYLRHLQSNREVRSSRCLKCVITSERLPLLLGWGPCQQVRRHQLDCSNN